MNKCIPIAHLNVKLYSGMQVYKVAAHSNAICFYSLKMYNVHLMKTTLIWMRTNFLYHILTTYLCHFKWWIFITFSRHWNTCMELFSQWDIISARYGLIMSHCETSMIRIWYMSNLQLNGENWLQKTNRYLCFESIIFSYITYFMRCHEPSKCVWPSNYTIMYKLILRFAK